MNNFSPVSKQATWLGIIFSFAPLGIVIGYGCTALLESLIPGMWVWRLGFALRAILLLPIPLLYYF